MGMLDELMAAPDADRLKLRQGVVIAVAAPTATVRLGGGSDASIDVVGVRQLSPALLHVNDVVWLLQDRGSLLILGPVAVPATPRSLFYTATLANGTATSFTDFSTHNAEGSLAVPYTMVVTAFLSHGANGAANLVVWQVRDEAGANINYKGVTMEVLTDWPARQPINNRMTTTMLGKKDYAAGVTCGFRLAYRVDTSNVYADVGIRVDLIPT